MLIISVFKLLIFFFIIAFVYETWPPTTQPGETGLLLALWSKQDNINALESAIKLDKK